MCTGYELGDVIPQWQRRRETISPVQPATSSRKWRLLATSLCTGSLWKRGKLFNFIFFSSIHDSSVSCPGILLRDSLVTWALASFHNNRPRRLRQSNNRDCALSKFRKWQDTSKVAWNQLQVTGEADHLLGDSSWGLLKVFIYFLNLNLISCFFSFFVLVAWVLSKGFWDLLFVSEGHLRFVIQIYILRIVNKTCFIFLFFLSPPLHFLKHKCVILRMT